MIAQLPSEEEWEVEPDTLDDICRAGANPCPRLIDCREEDEFALCRIAGAELIPLSRFAEEALRRLEGETRPLVIYCHHGMRSLRAAQFLRQKGFAKVWSLAGGIDRWSSQIDPSVPRY